jgi:hypothetical protein
MQVSREWAIPRAYEHTGELFEESPGVRLLLHATAVLVGSGELREELLPMLWEDVGLHADDYGDVRLIEFECECECECECFGAPCERLRRCALESDCDSLQLMDGTHCVLMRPPGATDVERECMLIASLIACRCSSC